MDTLVNQARAARARYEEALALVGERSAEYAAVVRAIVAEERGERGERGAVTRAASRLGLSWQQVKRAVEREGESSLPLPVDGTSP